MPEATEPEATEPDDGLFGPITEEATTPATEPEATTPPVTPPSTTPATPPTEESEDIFGPTSEPGESTPPATTPTTPAETPETDTDDLFGTSTTEETPAPSTPAPTEPTTDEGATDDLFGEGAGTTEDAATPPTEGAEATETPADEATDDDNIFGTSTGILREPGGLASAEVRTWIDNTGKHSCRGRLVRFLDGHVRILKDNGRTTTVPLYRLSTNDLSFVNRQASAQEALAPGQVAQSPSPEPLAAN